MAKNTIAILYPAYLAKGKVEWVAKKDYLTRTAEFLTKKLKTAINRAQVEAMLKTVEKGEDLEGEDITAAQKKAFAQIEEDFQNAEANLVERQAEADAAAEAERIEAEKKAVIEKRLVTVGTENMKVAENFAGVFKKFDFGANMTQCIPKGEVTDDELLKAFGTMIATENMTNWAIGDLVNALEDRGHENVVIQVCEEVKKSYSNVSNMARTCKAIKPADRHQRLSFTHFSTVATAIFEGKTEKQTDKIRRDLLEKAEEDKMNVAELRAATREKQGKAPDTTDKPKKAKAGNKRFLVIPVEAVEEAYYTDAEPDVDYDENIVIDLTDVTMASLNGDSVVWSPIPPASAEAAESEDEEEEVEEEDSEDEEESEEEEAEDEDEEESEDEEEANEEEESEEEEEEDEDESEDEDEDEEESEDDEDEEEEVPVKKAPAKKAAQAAKKAVPNLSPAARKKAAKK